MAQDWRNCFHGGVIMRPKSKKPSKQRKYQYTMPKHEVHKAVSAPLSRELRKKKGFRSLPVVKGDKVLIVSGKHKGKSGKVTRVNYSTQRIFIEKVIDEKADKTEFPVPIHPSNVVITKFNQKDKYRVAIINRRVKDDNEKVEVEEEEEPVIDMDELEEEEGESMKEEISEEEETSDEEFEIIEEDES